MTFSFQVTFSTDHGPKTYHVALNTVATANCNTKNAKSMVHDKWHMESANRRAA